MCEHCAKMRAELRRIQTLYLDKGPVETVAKLKAEISLLKANLASFVGLGKATEEVADLLFEYQDIRFTDNGLSKFFLQLERRLRYALNGSKEGKDAGQ